MAASGLPLTTILADVVDNQPDHAGKHNAERNAIRELQDFVSALGIAPLDLFPGSDDSAKLDAAIAYAGGTAEGRSPKIVMGNRIYRFNRTIGQPFDGFHLEGVGRGQQASITGGLEQTKKQHTTLKIDVPRAATGKPGYFINATSDTTRDYYLGGFSALSDNGVTQMYRAPYVAGVSAGFGECTFENQTFQNFFSVFGNVDEGCAMTICDIAGGWLIFECRSTGVHLQGSDNRRIFSDGVDWYQSDSVSAGGGKFMGIFNALGKSTVGPLYITAFGTWRGLKISGGVTTGLLDMHGAVIEGNNENQPCMGSLIRIEGQSNVSIRDSTVDDGMTNPSGLPLAPGMSVADRGLIDIASTNAQVSLDNIAFAHATGVALTTPCVYNQSPKSMITRMQTFKRGPDWGSQLPVIKGTQPLIMDATSSYVA